MTFNRFILIVLVWGLVVTAKGHPDYKSHFVKTKGNALMMALPPSQGITWKTWVGAQVNATSISKSANDEAWGDCGASSLNLLKGGEEGGVTYTHDGGSVDFAIGFGAEDTFATKGPLDIDFAAIIEDQTIKIARFGVIEADLGSISANDELMIFRVYTGVIQFQLNGSVIYEIDPRQNPDLRIEAALKIKGAVLTNYSATFFRPALTGDLQKSDNSNSVVRDAYMIAVPKYGLPPYQFVWSNGATDNTIVDLSAGSYSVTIYDSGGDSLKLNGQVAYKCNVAKTRNAQATETGFSKINGNAPAVITLSNYMEAAANGSLSFKLNSSGSTFHTVMRPLDASGTSTTDVAFILVNEKQVVLNGGDIPPINTPAFDKLNRVDPVPPATQPSTLLIWKNEFTDTAKVLQGNLNGIAIKNNLLYILKSGSTLNKGIPVSANSVITLEKNGSLYKVLVNALPVYESSVSWGNGIAFDVHLKSTTVGMEAIASTSALQLIASNTCYYDLNSNWEQVIQYDGLDNIVGMSRTYRDVMGRTTQVLSKDLSRNVVLATQTLYDAWGRQVAQTLPAPVFQSGLCYVEGFLKNTAGTAYTYANFDKDNYSSNAGSLSLGEKDLPEPVAKTTKGSLGWYYSSNNTEEPYVPVTDQPYSRVEYSKTNPEDVLKSSKPGLGLNHGSGHESYQFSMRSAGELYYVFGFYNSWKVYDLAAHFNGYSACRSMSDVSSSAVQSMRGDITKTITRDENGQESVGFSDVMGNAIASCMAGSVNGANQQTQVVKDLIDVSVGSIFPFVDVHLAKGCESTLLLDQPNTSTPSNGPITYQIIDLSTERYVTFNGSINFKGTTPNLPAGCYRIKVDMANSTLLTGALTVRYNTNYYQFTLNYFDRANRLRISVPPKGVDYSGGGITSVNVNNQTINSPFVAAGAGNPHTVVNQGANTVYLPQFQLSAANYGTNEIGLTIPTTLATPGSQWVHNFVVSFTGKATQYAINFPNDNTSAGGSGQRTIAGTQVVASSDMSMPVLNQDSTDVVYKEELPVQLNDTNLVLNKTLAQAACGTTIIPVEISYDLLDHNGNLISPNETVTGYCKIVDCGTSYSRTWNFPPAKTYQINNIISTPNVTPYVKLSITGLRVIKTPNYSSIPFTVYTDISAFLARSSGTKLQVPPHTMTEVFDYNTASEALAVKKPDSGTTETLYETDGKARFTQNAKQDIVQTVAPGQSGDKFSYVNYDEYDRPVLSGEHWTGLSSGSGQNVKFQNLQEFLLNGAPAGYLSTMNLILTKAAHTELTRTKEKHYIVYDVPDPNFASLTGISFAPFKQNYLIGEVSYTWNENRKTWYSYDELGRVKWVVQRYENVPSGTNPYSIKSFYYEYDYMGNVLTTRYNYHLNAGADDKADYVYTYDADKRLIKTQVLPYGPNSQGLRTVSQLRYYLHGPLKRKELGDGLQGQDYVYTLNGWLKSINGPEMDLAHDPGKDGEQVMGRVSYPDVFGMALDYHENDYARPGTSIQTLLYMGQNNPYGAPLYNGLVKTQRWQTRTPNGSSGLVYQNQHLFYDYKYDAGYQLKEAQFGVVTANGNQNASVPVVPQTFPALSLSTDYKVSNLSYDLNGNLLTLSRNAYATGSGGLQMDNLNYTYATCTNKHTQVNDGVSSTAYASYGFAPGQATGNYVYNVLGELEADAVNGKKYEYNSTGQISRILNTANQPVAEYVYDESGQRMLKISYNGSTVVKTFYVRDGDGSVIAIHEQNGGANPYVLKELALSGDGREGTVYKQAGGDVYSYELTDHLGSTRAVIKEGALQTLAFNMDAVPATGNNLTYFTDHYTTIVNAGGNKVSRVQAPAKPEGVSTVLIPVKAGDVVLSRVYAAFTTVVSGSSINAWLVGDVLDENGNVLSTQGVQVSSSSYQTNVQYILNQSIVQNGYLRVYVKSNELFAVDFDDLQVQFSVGGVRIPEVMEAVAYYPHGSELPGLSYHSSLGGRYGYQGQYAERDKEVNEDFFELRNYNSLLGRFNTIDPYEQYWSPYLAMGNNHPNMVDPDGGFGVGVRGVGTWWGAGAGLVAGVVLVGGIDYFCSGPNNQKHKFDLHGGWYVGAGLVGIGVGGFAGGIIENGGKLNGAVVFGNKFIKQKQNLDSGWPWKIERLNMKKKLVVQNVTIGKGKAVYDGQLFSTFSFLARGGMLTVLWNHLPGDEWGDITSVTYGLSMASSGPNFIGGKGSFKLKQTGQPTPVFVTIQSLPRSIAKFKIKESRAKWVPKWQFWKKAIRKQ